MLPLVDIVTILLHGGLQKVLYLIPLIYPLEESRDPPSWWYEFWGWGDWYYNLDSSRRPNEKFIDNYLHAGWGYLKMLAVYEAEIFTSSVQVLLLNVIGPVFYGFLSVSAWLNNVDLKVGFDVPSWAASALSGLWKLFYWLPEEIRDWAWGWWDVWDRNVDRALEIAGYLYDEGVDWAWEAVDYVWNAGYQIRDWWLPIGGFLDWLFADPYGATTSFLGSVWWWLHDFSYNAVAWVWGWLAPWWDPLVTFAANCLWYWYDLWGLYASLLSDFLADPLDFIGDRLEAIVERFW